MPLILDGMASLCCAASLEKQRFSAFALLTWLSWSVDNDMDIFHEAEPLEERRNAGKAA